VTQTKEELIRATRQLLENFRGLVSDGREYKKSLDKLCDWLEGGAYVMSNVQRDAVDTLLVSIDARVGRNVEWVYDLEEEAKTAPLDIPPK
jgi:hypothetical protein